MDVAKNVEYGLKVKKVPKSERAERVTAALASVRLEAHGGRKPHQLSGGQRQRVALARALVNRPKVLLLDEPLGALDLKLREEMQVELKQIQQQVGITFVFVTHDQGEALSMSDRVAVFNDGRVEQVGPPREIYEHPATPFVAGFVGTANLLADGDGLVTVRPERIRLGAPSGDETGTAGTVDAVQYLGATTRYRVHTDDGTILIGGGGQHHGVVHRRGGRHRAAGVEPDRSPAGGSAGGAMSSTINRQQTQRGGDMRRKRHRLAGVAMALMLVAAACGDDDDGGDGASDTTAPEVQDEIGEGEGALSILAWPYYAEDGTQDPNFDWVTAFEEDTGCTAEVKYFGTSDEAFTLFGSGDYDVVSASGDSSMRSVASGDAAAINTELLTNYDDLAPFLKEQAWNSLDGTVYGVPHGWGANVLQYNADVVDPAPTSWGAVFDPDSPYAGQDRRLRLAHLHRRRGGVPDGDAAGPRDREPVRPRRGAVHRGHRPAQGAERSAVRVLERLRRLRGQLPRRQHRARARAGRSSPARSRPMIRPW